jgi:phenylacetate-CoA ligase
MFQISQLSTLRSLLRHHRATREEIVAFQNKHLRRLIAHAYHNVPYYRRLFDRNGLKPQDIRSVADLSAIPITSKKDLQQLPVEDVVARGVDPRCLIIHRTSGSSGEPFTIRSSRSENRLLSISMRRGAHYYGLHRTDKLAIMNIHSTQPTHLLRRMFQLAGLYRMSRINSLLPPEEIVRALLQFQPDVFIGYAGVLARISELAGEAEHQAIRPRFIISRGDVLTPLMRQQITAAFAAPVYDIYGSRELRCIAYECKETREYHTCDDNVIVEVLKDGRTAETGERGEVVGTNLHSFAMPFIRYRIGDIVTKGSATCPCGLPFSTIRAVQGRMIDYFPLPGGSMIHPYEIGVETTLNKAQWIRQYQLVQEREDLIVLRVVPSVHPSPQELSRMQESAAAILGQGVEFRVLLVPEIQLELSGKFRVFRSLVKSGYDGINWDCLETSQSKL